MAKAAVETHGVSIRLACECLCISETCYRYEAKLDVENQRIADWLLRLTQQTANGDLVCVICIYGTSKAIDGIINGSIASIESLS